MSIARRSLRLLAAVAIAAVALAGFQSVASAQADPYAPPVVTVGPVNTATGEVTITGSGFCANTTVTIRLVAPATDLGTTTADANGAFSFSVPVPLEPGEYTVVSTEPTCEDEQTTTFTVTAAEIAEILANRLPATGSNSTTSLLRAGIVLLAAGALITFGVRANTRRRQHIDA